MMGRRRVWLAGLVLAMMAAGCGSTGATRDAAGEGL
jgi:hypothetical protein